MSALVDKIKTRGHWLVRIRSDVYMPDAVDSLLSLEKAVQESAVSLRGWDFPHYDYKSAPVRTGSAVEQSIDWEHFVELWRATRSGQFVSLSAFPEDWRDQSALWPAPEGWSPLFMSVESTVFRFVEIFEFAARWCRALDLESPIVIDTSVFGLKARQLHLGPRRVSLSYPRECHVESWSRSDRYSLAELAARPRELAIAPAIELFELFGLDIGSDVVTDMQEELSR